MKPPQGPPSNTLACSRILPTGECGKPADWHVSWYEDGVRSVAWGNSLCCDEHKHEAEQTWAMGWRHRVLPACALPGSLFAVAAEGDDEDGLPLTYCFHPLDQAHAVAEAEELLTRSPARSLPSPATPNPTEQR